MWHGTDVVSVDDERRLLIALELLIGLENLLFKLDDSFYVTASIVTYGGVIFGSVGSCGEIFRYKSHIF